MSFDLKLHAYRLLMDEPFFAALSRKIEKRADYNIPTAGVRVCPDSAQFEMIYNPDFFAKLSEEHVRGVLKHEFYHLIFEPLPAVSLRALITRLGISLLTWLSIVTSKMSYLNWPACQVVVPLLICRSTRLLSGT